MLNQLYWPFEFLRRIGRARGESMERLIVERTLAAGFATLVLVTAGATNNQVSAQENQKSVAEFQGVVVPAREAEFTPLVTGWLTEIRFKPGQHVEKGDVLFVFSKIFQQLLIKQEDARIEAAAAALKEAEARLARSKTLIERDAISQANLLEAEAGRDIAKAKLKELQAAHKIKTLELEYLDLKAPFAGIMSAPQVKENGWQDKSARENIRLATITQLDPIRVAAKVPYSVYSERRKMFGTDAAMMKGVSLKIVLPDGAQYPHEGRYVSGGYKFSSDTQDVTVWAEFPNPDHLLRPGLEVRVESRIAKP